VKHTFWCPLSLIDWRWVLLIPCLPVKVTDREELIHLIWERERESERDRYRERESERETHIDTETKREIITERKTRRLHTKDHNGEDEIVVHFHENKRL